MKITYAAAMSFDGYIARADGDVSWLDEMNISFNETGLEQFFASIDGLIMGRKTYDFVYHYGTWPYEKKPTWVCTHNELPRMDGADLRIVADIDQLFREAASQGLQHLWFVGGGVLASEFLVRGLLTNLSISEMPIRLESGIPLFANHRLEDIPYLSRSIIQKTGFRQIEMALVQPS